MISGIKVGDNWLVMKPAIPTIRRESPLFSYTGVPAAMVTYPFTIDYEENAKFLDFPASPALIVEKREYECQVLFFNCWLVKGLIQVLRTNGKQIEILVGSPFYDITNELFKTKIKDLAWEDELIAGPCQIYIDILFEEIGVFPFPDDTLVFNTSYAEYTHNVSGLDSIAIAANAMATLINADTSLSGISAEVIFDTLRLKQVELGAHNKVFNTNLMAFTSLLPRFTLTVDYISWLEDWHDELGTAIEGLALSNTVWPYKNYQFNTQFNKDHYGDLNLDFTGWINVFEEDVLQMNFRGTGSGFDGNKYTLSPSIFYHAVLDKILFTGGLRMTGRGYSNNNFKLLLIDNNFSIGKEWYDPVNDNEVLAFADRIHIPNHLPDMTIGEFINEYCIKFNLWISGFDEGTRTITLSYRDDSFNNGGLTSVPVVDFSAVPIQGLPVHDFNIKTSLHFSSPQDSADEASGIYFTHYNNEQLQHTDYIIGLGELSISSLWSFPSVISSLYITSFDEANYFKCPIKKCAGSGDEWGGRRNAFSPRLIIYRGWQVGTNGLFYNYSTNDHLESLQQDDGFTLSLIWPKTYELFWTKWGSFEASVKRRVTIKQALTVDQYIAFKWDRWYRFLEAEWLPVQSEVIAAKPGLVLTEIIYQKKDTPY